MAGMLAKVVFKACLDTESSGLGVLFLCQKNTATTEHADVLALHDPLKSTFILN